MRKGWPKKKVSEIARHSLGKMLDKAKNKGEPRPYLRNLNVRWFVFDLSDLLEMRFLPEEGDKYTVKKGDLVICEGGYPGRAAIWDQDEPVYFQKALHRVRFREPEHAKWCLYYLHAQDIEGTLKKHFNGAGIQHFTGEALARFEIPLPPLPEQQRIIGILDEAFEGIATAKTNAEKNLQNARAIFDSHLQSVFTQRGEGWVDRKLGDLSKINYGYTESACAEPVGPKFLRITDIQDNRVDWNTVPYCPIDASDVRKYQLAEGDIVFARTGATTGKSYLINEPPDAVFASYLIRVQLAVKELLPPFLFLFFQTRSYWDSIKSGSSGSAQGGFNATKLGELVIPYPKQLKEQQGIIAKLAGLTTETERLISIYKQKLAALEALKKSLLHQAFGGQL